ncbi:hypothetical protein HK098_006314 [Nowakowskiella sp. JEL0407]|nr:hypothetical protein HK098_006314 [Nowakowskiella sp. JEL0407]
MSVMIPAEVDHRYYRGNCFMACEECHLIPKAISAANLLYCCRTVFPSLPIRFAYRDEEKTVFLVGFRHKETGFRLGFSDKDGASQMLFGFDDDAETHENLAEKWIYGSFTEEERGLEIELNRKAELFTNDIIELLDRFVPGDRAMFHHPSAYVSPDSVADYSLPMQQYYTVNPAITKNLYSDPTGEKAKLMRTMIKSIGAIWEPGECSGAFQEADLSNSSPLKALIDNIHKSISSPLLFYRLLCFWNTRKTLFTQFSSGNGVWSVTLKSRDGVDGAKIVLFDLHGLAKVKVSKELVDSELEKRACEILEFLVSDEFPHRFKPGLVAGSALLSDLL